MATPLRDTVTPADTLDRLDIRLGRVLSAEPTRGTPRPAYRLSVDFGRYSPHSAAEFAGGFLGRYLAAFEAAQDLGVRVGQFGFGADGPQRRVEVGADGGVTGGNGRWVTDAQDPLDLLEIAGVPVHAGLARAPHAPALCSEP